jgi:large conductance mechanosensitive channel
MAKHPLLKEFEEFALRGNMVDLAVGVVIGAAFARVVASIVEHLIMPPVSLIMGGVDFPTWRIPIRAAENGKPEVAIQIGQLLNNVVQFFLVAIAIFFVVKLVNRLTRRQKVTLPPGPEVELLKEIRDLLKRDAAAKEPGAGG